MPCIVVAVPKFSTVHTISHCLKFHGFFFFSSQDNLCIHLLKEKERKGHFLFNVCVRSLSHLREEEQNTQFCTVAQHVCIYFWYGAQAFVCKKCWVLFVLGHESQVAGLCRKMSRCSGLFLLQANPCLLQLERGRGGLA